MSNLIERLQHMADDAMGMEPEDRRAILEAITELGKLGEWQDCARQKQEIIDSETALRKEAESRLDLANKTVEVQLRSLASLGEQRDAAVSRLDAERSEFAAKSVRMASQHDEINALQREREHLRNLVNGQAEDDGLWFRATTAPEAYLQQELRKLHAAIESNVVETSLPIERRTACGAKDCDRVLVVKSDDPFELLEPWYCPLHENYPNVPPVREYIDAADHTFLRGLGDRCQVCGRPEPDHSATP